MLKLIALLLIAPSAWAVNKCTAADGSVAYQEAPCTGKGETIKLPAQPEVSPVEVVRNNAVANGRVMVGMTAQQVRRAWGTPTTINKTVGGHGVSEQWVYDRGDFRAQYVYLDDGAVTSVQTPIE